MIAEGPVNPYTDRLADLFRRLARRRIDVALVRGVASVRALTGVVCDNAWLVLEIGTRRAVFYTDFRYLPMVRRTASALKAVDIARFKVPSARRIGCEFSLSHATFERLRKEAPRSCFIDLDGVLSELRAVKTSDEITKLRAAERLTCEIWRDARARFRAGMTEREMARTIRMMMIERGEGEAFETIVCIGRNAAECHHVPDDTVWDGKEPVLVDMGVKLDGYCSDLTRNIVPKRPSAAYRAIYDLVASANRAAIAAARPGLTGRELDAVARRIIAKAGHGRDFGHSLGHGVGLEIHEAPTASRRSVDVLKPGMLVTIEPGVYIEGEMGVRIEDLVLITETGCEVLSREADA